MHVGHEELPHTGVGERAHAVADTVPVVEVADDAHGLGVGRPDRERRAGDVTHDARVGAHVRTEHVPQLLVTTLTDEVEVDLAERRHEAVRVVPALLRAVLVGCEDAVVGHVLARGGAHPDALVLVCELDALIAHLDGDRACHRTHDTERDDAVGNVSAEDAVRVAVFTG